MIALLAVSRSLPRARNSKQDWSLLLRFELLHILLRILVKRIAAAGAADVKCLAIQRARSLPDPAAHDTFLALFFASEGFALFVAGYEITSAIDLLGRLLRFVPVVEAYSVAGHVHGDLLRLLFLLVRPFEYE